MRIAAPGLCAGALLLVVSAALSGCADSSATTSGPTTGNGSTGTTTNVTVAVSPSTQTIDAGQTVALSATVSGDSSNRGVFWTVDNGAGTLSSTSASSTVFTSSGAAATPVSVTATSNLDPTKSARATINIVPAPSFTSTGQLTQGYRGLAYSTALPAAGGIGSRTFALAGGTALPAGLTLNSSSGIISGTPTAAGTTTFSVSVTDAAATPITTSASFTIGISALQVDPPAIVNAVAGKPYPALTYSAEFNQGAVTYAVTAGALPTGLSLSSAGVLSGTPTAAGTGTYTVTATDAAGQVAIATQTITVVPALALTGFTIHTVTAGAAITPVTFAATGGTAPYTYRVAAGSVLPAGLSLNGTTGVLSGAPSMPGSSTFAVTASDSGAASLLQTASATSTLSVGVAPLVITSGTLPNAVPGSPYHVQLGASGGIAPYSFAITGGSLPDGVLLSSAGMLVGRASTLGPANFTVTVTDAQGTPATVSKALTLNVTAALTPGPNNAGLKGSYAFVLTGQTNGAFSVQPPIAGAVYGADVAGSLTFDGTSLVTGTIDTNSARFGTASAIAVTGSYSIGNDNRGTVVLNYGTTTLTYIVALSRFNAGVAGRISLIEGDSDNPNNPDQAAGSGEAFLQTASAFNLASLQGSYVFRFNGETPANSTQFGALSAAGYLFLDGAGLITRGSMDASSFNTSYQQVSMTGSYTAPNAAGRGTLIATPVGLSYPAAPTHFVYYVIDQQQIVLMSTDAHGPSSLMAGPAFQQQQTIYSTASLTGTIITAENALTGGDGTSTFQNNVSAIFYVLQIASPGRVSGYDVRNDSGTTVAHDTTPLQGTYTVSDNGRVVFNTPNGLVLPVLWLYDIDKGVGTEISSSLGGCLDTRTGAAGCVGTVLFDRQTTTTPPANKYALGTVASVIPASFASGVVINPGGSGQTTLDIVQQGGISYGQSIATSSQLAADGRFRAAAGPLAFTGFVYSPAKIIVFESTQGRTNPVMYLGEQ